ncbi:MAG: family 10 glycosylhydrolase, partial [Fidelibacterota bacterium]
MEFKRYIIAFHKSQESYSGKYQILKIKFNISLILFTIIFSSLLLFSSCEERRPPIPALKGKALWVHPGDIGKTAQEVNQFIDLVGKANINLIIPLVKDTGGRIYWRSRLFPEAVHPDWRSFDLLDALVREAHTRNIKVHAWFCDFPEGENSPAYTNHPEWAMINQRGETTLSEKLGGGKPYRMVWMCPLKKPGYTDQWLVPMMEEVTENYEVDGIHHDYVRFPGDVAPDSYCFADHFLDEFFRYHKFYYDSFPDSVFKPSPVLPRGEANWWLDYTVRPAGWDTLSREEKAAFILKGGSLNTLLGREAPADLNYFFYEFRADVISRFVRETTQKLKAIRPDIEISAAVFKNPFTSARNIGQKWTDFAPYVDIMMPMNYRSHSPGGFETYLTMLGEYISSQKEWLGNRSSLWIGIATTYLYKEEYQPLDRIIKYASSIMEDPSQNLKEKIKTITENYTKIYPNLMALKPELAEKVSQNYQQLKWYSRFIIFKPEQSDTAQVEKQSFYEDKIKQSAEILLNTVREIRRNPPPGYYPP